MKSKFRVKVFLCLCFFCMANIVRAEDVKLGELVLSNPYIRAMPGNAKVTSGYFEIRNEGQESDQLLEVYTKAAARIEIHEMRVENDIMRMRPLPQGLEIPPGETISLAPGGYHLMIFEPIAGSLENGTFPIMLHFAVAGKVDVGFNILDIKNTKERNHHHQHGS